MIDTSNPDGISVGSVHGQCACDLLAAQTKADALAKRVEELETLLADLGDAELKQRVALGRGDPNPYLYYRSIEDKTVAVMQEGIQIAERRAGLAKYLCECGKRNDGRPL